MENWLRRVGFVYVAGTDEVGRGCLAGPVVAVLIHGNGFIAAFAGGITFGYISRGRFAEPTEFTETLSALTLWRLRIPAIFGTNSSKRSTGTKYSCST